MISRDFHPAEGIYNEFNYQDFWGKRKYEDSSGKLALNKLFDKINCKSKKKLIDIGAGYGRLAKVYGKKFNHSTLVDPSDKNLKVAQEKLGSDKFSFVKAVGSQLPLDDQTFDVGVMVRVIHHLFNPQKVIKEIYRVLKPQSWFILEFANKCHLKSKVFNFKESKSLAPVDISKTTSGLPFKNYHPLWVENMLKKNKFQPVVKLSVSNFRNPVVKNLLPHSLLLYLENKLQKPLGKINFGPSMFLLSKRQ